MAGKPKGQGTGVNFNKETKKYCARIYREGREYYIGSFDTENEAVRARAAALDKLDSGVAGQGYTKPRYISNAYPGDEYDFFLDGASRTSMNNPEHVVRMNVLLGAIQDLKKSRRSVFFKEAVEWFRGEQRYPEGYSFDEICTLFRLDPDAVREALQREHTDLELAA